MTAKQMQLLSIGEAMAELRSAGPDFAVGFAGDTFNTAVYCRRLLPPAMQVGYLTHVGTDPLSDGFVALARAEGIGTSAITRDPLHNIGIYSVQTDAAGERSFHYWRSASAARQLFRGGADLAVLDGAERIFLSAITLAILAPEAREALLDRLATLRATGTAIAFDSNYRPRLWPDAETARDWTRRMWLMTDVALASVDDEQALFGDADASAVLDRLRTDGCREGALKCGARGPIPIAPDISPGPFAPAAQVVDTTAAGDSFNGAYLAARILGHDEGAAMDWGHRMAATVIGQPGAIIPRTIR